MSKGVRRDAYQKEKVLVGCALLFCFIIHVVLIKQGSNWYCVDIKGYLGHAATFSGRDWSGVLKNIEYFYSWGYSLLLTFPMILTGNSTVVYYFAVFSNAVLCCGILLICYKIAKEIVRDIEQSLLLLCSTAVSVYSSYVFQGSVMLSEVYLYFFVLLSIFCLLRYIRTDRIFWGILSGVFIGYTYIIHNRSIGMVIAYIIVSIAWSVKTRNWKKALVMLLPLILMLLLNQGVLQYLKYYEKQGMEYTKNTYSSQASKLKKGIHFYSIISAAKCVFGEVWYALIGSFGLIGIGICSVLKKAYESWKNNDNDLIWYAFLILMLLGMLSVSVLGCMPKAPMGESGRYDIYIYGRYWEMSFSIFILFGFLTCCKGVEKSLLINIIFCSIFLSTIVEYFTKAYQDNIWWWSSIPAVLTTFFYPQRKFTVLASSIVGIIFMIWIFFQFSQCKKFSFIISTGIWMTFNIFTGYSATYNMMNIDGPDMTFGNENFKDVCSYLGENEIDEFAVYSEQSDYPAVFQVAFPDKKIIGVNSTEVLENVDIYIFEKTIETNPYKGDIIYENEKYIIMYVNSIS